MKCKVCNAERYRNKLYCYKHFLLRQSKIDLKQLNKGANKGNGVV